MIRRTGENSCVPPGFVVTDEPVKPSHSSTARECAKAVKGMPRKPRKVIAEASVEEASTADRALAKEGRAGKESVRRGSVRRSGMPTEVRREGNRGRILRASGRARVARTGGTQTQHSHPWTIAITKTAVNQEPYVFTPATSRVCATTAISNSIFHLANSKQKAFHKHGLLLLLFPRITVRCLRRTTQDWPSELLRCSRTLLLYTRM